MGLVEGDFAAVADQFGDGLRDARGLGGQNDVQRGFTGKFVNRQVQALR